MAIVSFRHGFIFVKTTKTAGTSIEVELGKRIEPEAIVTPVIPAVTGHLPRNYKRGLFRKPYFNHMTAAMISSHLGQDVFDRMFKFCVEREPVSKCISHFHMLRNSALHRARGRSGLSWEDYCAAGDFPIDTDKLTSVRDGQRVRIIDEVIRYEDLQSSLDRIAAKVGLAPFKLETTAKSEYSGTIVIRKEEVTPAQRKTIYDAFGESLAVAGLADHYRV